MSEKNILEALTAEMLGDIGNLHDDVKQLADALPEAASIIRQAGLDSASSIQAAVNKSVEHLSKNLATIEVAKLQTSLITNLEKSLDDFHKQKSKSTLFTKKIRAVMCPCLISLISVTAGILIGVYCAEKHRSQEEIKQIAAGKDFLKILPLLDPLTKKRLISLLKEKN